MNLSPTKIRNLRRVYGLTGDQWLELIKAGRCPLCEKRYTPARTPVVDHHHTTGLVRGATCSACNYRIGLLHEDVGWLRRAADYLTDPPALSLIGVHHVPGSPSSTPAGGCVG